MRDRTVLLSLEELPRQQAFGQELYPTVFLKAALYARNIITAHPFVDGNKRTGMSSAFVFLENNDFESTAKEGEIEKFALKIATEKLQLGTIASWFKNCSKKINKKSAAG